MINSDFECDPHFYRDGYFFFDTIVNGARSGTPVASAALGDLYQYDESIAGYRVIDPIAISTLVEVKVIILTAFDGTGQAMTFGRAGATAAFSYFGTDAQIQPGVQGVKETTSQLAAATSLLTAPLVPKMRWTYTGTPTAGVARCMLKLLPSALP